jgi:hypothetical protein
VIRASRSNPALLLAGPDFGSGLLAPLAGRIYDHAPQQNTDPLI